jgi:hypothetical protein
MFVAVIYIDIGTTHARLGNAHVADSLEIAVEWLRAGMRASLGARQFRIRCHSLNVRHLFFLY